MFLFKLNHNSINGFNMVALNFLSYCIRENFRSNQFNYYEGDCNYLLKLKPDILTKYEIDLNTLYD